MAKPKPKYGVGGGVVSAKPAARGGRSSVIMGTPPIGRATHGVGGGVVSAKPSPLSKYLKLTAGKRVK